MEGADAVPDIGGMLTQKLGPLPLWAWGGAAIGGGYLLYRSGLLSNITGGGGTTTSTTAAQQAQTAAGQATSSEAAAQQAAAAATGQSAGAQLSQSIGLLQQLQQFQQASYSSQLQQEAQTQQAAAALGQAPGQTPGGPTPVANAPYMRDPTTGAIYDTAAGCKRHLSLAEWNQITTAGGNAVNVDPQQLSYIPDCTSAVPGLPSASGVTPQTTGGGSGGPKRSMLGAAHPLWRPGHPLLGGPRAGAVGADITYPHYAVGGPRDVRHVASQVGVHPARILALNGRSQQGRVGRGQPLRVA